VTLRILILAAAAASALSVCSCGTPYRYEYYDYKGKTVDEKNAEREKAIDQRFRGFVPGSSSGRAYR